MGNPIASVRLGRITTCAFAPLLAVSFAASADVILDYQGRVTTVNDRCWCQSLDINVGDAVAGRVVIDTDMAPPDSNPDPLEALYEGTGSANPNFVIGRHSLLGNLELRGPDAVGVTDQHPGVPYEGLFVRDASASRSGGDFTQLLLGLGHTFNLEFDLIHGDGLAQSFTTGQDLEHGVATNGSLTRRSRSFSYFVGFVVDRLSVKPGTCHP